jgi:hypothetical protein
MSSRYAAALAALALAGCAFAQPQVAGQTPSMQECAQAGRFAFAGEATLAELGLDQFAGGAELNRPARIWVTADPVQMGGGFAPAGVPQPPPERVVCVEWPDGSGMMGPVPRDWQPPSVLDTAAEPAGLPPVVPLLLAAVAIAAASYLAFRRAER